MLHKLFSHTRAIARHREGVFGAHIDEFAAYLDRQGYARFSVRLAVQAVGRLGRWFASQGLDATDACEVTIIGFHEQDAFAGSVRHGCRKALCLLLEHLRARGVPSTVLPRCEPSEAELLVGEFGRYLREERSLSANTVVKYCPEAERFICERFGTDRIELTKLSVTDLHAFVSRHAHQYSARRVQLMLTALRSFLRFLYLRGHTSLRLDEHVPTAPAWRKTDVPKWLSDDDIKRVLASCDRDTEIGQRDYAILLLLARLGLRAGEVVTLELGDIRWETAEISVCGKGRHRKRFPLPGDVGEALATYLKCVRRRCDSRRVFLRVRAPYREISGSSTLDTIVRKALLRAGLDPPLKGAHLFRHSLATKMLRRGATLTEIGQILHHTNPDTTSIYAKVDIDGLRALAMPWPGDCT